MTNTQIYKEESGQHVEATKKENKNNKKKIVGGVYEIGKTLGKGTYSTVKHAVNLETNNEVAIKIMKIATPADMQDIEREIAILKLLKHPNIIKLLDVIYKDNNNNEKREKKDNNEKREKKDNNEKKEKRNNNKVYLVFEYISGGDLFDYTCERIRIREERARKIMREIISGVAYCHAHMIVHRDLKLENLLMDCDGHAKIADFGLSGILKPGLKLNTFCGSPMYMSPEMVQGLGYGPGVDIWSLGVVLYTILVGQTPWSLNKQKVVEDTDAMLRGEYTIPDHVTLSPECKDLIRMMIVPEHARRASIEQIMSHPWITEEHDEPISVPLNVPPVQEVKEVVIKQMIAMGYPEQSTRKAVQNNTPCPARMVYQWMLHQMEESVVSPLIPSQIPRKGRRSSTSHVHDASAKHSASRRLSCDSQFVINVNQSPRTALTSSWRHLQMSTIKEENPVPIPTSENSSSDNYPSRSPSPSTFPSPLKIDSQSSPPISPPISPTTEEIQLVRASTVAAATLKPRRALLAEITRALTDAGITHTLTKFVFECVSPRAAAQEDLRFEVEVCRMAGLEMLLGIRFRRVAGSAADYNDMCNLLMTYMKL